MPTNTIDSQAEKRLQSCIDGCARNGLGCRYCSTGPCLTQFQGRIGEIMEFRRQLRSKERHVREFELVLMFSEADEIKQRIGHLSQQGDDHEVCETSADEEIFDTSEGEVFQTSDSEQNQQLRPLKKQRRAKVRSCKLLGESVCSKALLRLLALSVQAVTRLKRGEPDLRRGSRAKGPQGLSLKMRKDGVSHHIMEFFWQLHHSCAEGLPNKLKFLRAEKGTLRIMTKEAEQKAESSTLQATAPATDADDEELKPYMIEDSSEEERLVHGAVIQLTRQRPPDEHLRAGQLGDAIPRRYLPPGRPVHLYWQYIQVARSRGLKVPSYSAFMRVFRIAFKDIGFLRFRKNAGDHSKCTACEGFKAELKHCRTQAIKEQTMEATRYNSCIT